MWYKLRIHYEGRYLKRVLLAMEHKIYVYSLFFLFQGLVSVLDIFSGRGLLFGFLETKEFH